MSEWGKKEKEGQREHEEQIKGLTYESFCREEFQTDPKHEYLNRFQGL